MLRRLPAVWSLGIVCSLFVLTACAEPPSREMDQAQGALDAARAAGADQYATTQYEAAAAALKSARAAVEARDYRLALNYALDSRDRAQNAAKAAADQQVVLRSGAERRLTELTALLDQARLKLGAAESARAPRRSLAAPRSAIAKAEVSLQKAGTQIQEGAYQASYSLLSESATLLQSAIAGTDIAMRGRGAKPQS